MAEYIEREALITKFKKMELGEHGLVERLFADGVYAVIAAFPAADVAPVVWCKNCRSYNKPKTGWCEVHLDREHPDDFCGYGEQKDGGASNG